MKLKLILVSILFPLIGFGAQTNQMDNLLVKFNLITTNLNVRGTTTLGGNSSSTIIINAGTASVPNNLILGSLFLPSASSGSYTNGYTTNQFNGDLFVLRGIMSSNLVVTTTTGMSSISSGTNLTLTIDSAGGAGVGLLQMLYTVRTNTLTAALPVVNAIYTNNAQRLDLNIGAVMAVNSYAFIWTQSAGVTQMFGAKGTSVAFTNTFTGKIQPNALYAVSNQLGTTTLLPGQWNETRE